MKALSIRQPWASLIINGYKEYEFRSWKTNFRGEFLIHASKNIENENMDKFNEYNLVYPTGCILGKCTITDCIKVTKEFEENLKEKNKLVYGLSKGRGGYAFKVEEIEKFDAEIPAKGKLNFWEFKEI